MTHPRSDADCDYVLMPREATRTMTMAGCDSLPSCEHVFGHAGEMLRNAYRKMVEVASLPTTPCTSGGREEIAKAIYESDHTFQHEDGGEQVDGFQVTPAGYVTWNQLREMSVAACIPFLRAADAILALTEQNSGPTAGREEVTIWESVSKNVKERLGENEGAWRSCSGCYEMEDGQNVHGYPHSDVFGCELGGGCSECGGIGAIWDTTDYAAMGDELSLEWIAKQSEAEGARVADLALVAKNALSPSFDKSEGGK